MEYPTTCLLGLDVDDLDFAIAEFQDTKMQPALERALRRRGPLKA